MRLILQVGFGLSKYLLFVWLDYSFLHNSKKIIFQTKSYQYS